MSQRDVAEMRRLVEVEVEVESEVGEVRVDFVGVIFGGVDRDDEAWREEEEEEEANSRLGLDVPTQEKGSSRSPPPPP
jgi:hypothetical protein